jgi:outer membrane lipoprotein SlyB
MSFRKTRSRELLPVLVSLSAFGILGCTFPSNGTVVPQSQAQVMHSLEKGTVLAVKEVVLEGDRSALGRWGGGAVGAAASAPDGRIDDTGGRLATAAGGVAGAIAGEAVEEAVTRVPAQEITIQLDSGRTVMITQEATDGLFRQGDRVQVAHGRGSALVRLAIN